MACQQLNTKAQRHGGTEKKRDRICPLCVSAPLCLCVKQCVSWTTLARRDRRPVRPGRRDRRGGRGGWGGRGGGGRRGGGGGRGGLRGGERRPPLWRGGL